MSHDAGTGLYLCAKCGALLCPISGLCSDLCYEKPAAEERGAAVHDALGDMVAVMRERGGTWTLSLDAETADVVIDFSTYTTDPLSGEMALTATRPDPEAAVVAVLCQLSMQEATG